MTTRRDGDWLIDDRNNRYSISHAGSEDGARQALASLASCYDCSDCSGCSGCYRCSGCSDLTGEKRELPPVPAIPNIHKTIYAAATEPGALNMGSWHKCDTTHCRAGWAVHLAGKEGYALEAETSTLFAAMQIYKASGSPISPVRFFETDEVALADMKRLAEAS